MHNPHNDCSANDGECRPLFAAGCPADARHGVDDAKLLAGRRCLEQIVTPYPAALHDFVAAVGPSAPTAMAQAALATWIGVGPSRVDPLFESTECGRLRPSVVLADALLFGAAHARGREHPLHDFANVFERRLDAVLMLTAFLDAASVALPALLVSHTDAANAAGPQRPPLLDCVCVPTRAFTAAQLAACR